jgi:gliding motility-associated-like protein
MLKLPHPMKSNNGGASFKVTKLLYKVLLPILLLMCGQVNAQTVKAVINPTGGTSATSDIKIEILSDGGIVVTRKGLTESYSKTDSTTGLRAFFDFKNPSATGGAPESANLKSPSVCYISPVSGSGSSADPYKVHIIGTILDKYYGSGAGQTGTVTCIVSYISGTSYFFLDYVMHMPDISPGTTALFYLSEQSLMGSDGSIDPDEASKCGYGYVSPDAKTVGIIRTVSCPGTPEGTRSHVYRTYNRYESFEASIPENRFYIEENGFFPGNVVNTGIDGRGRSLGIMRNLGMLISNAFSPNPANIKTFRILSGYGTSATEFDAVPGLQDSIKAVDYLYNVVTPRFTPVKVAFTSASMSGNEGSGADGDHIASGLTLNVSGGKLGAPAYVLLQYDPSTSFAHPAVQGVDFTLYQEAVLIPAGDYTTAKNIPVSNLHVIGNDALEYSRSLRLKLVNTCASVITVNGTSECDYTIVDDEPRTMQLVMDSTQVLEGSKTKARIKLPSGMTVPEPITITFSTLPTSTAGDTDYIAPASVIIPANASNSPDFDIIAKSDKTLENTEKLTLRFQGSILGISVTGQSDLLIQDSTYFNPAYSKVYIDPINPASAMPIVEGYSGKLSVHLAPGVATEVPITFRTYTTSGTADEGLDYTLDLPTGKTYIINPGATSTEIPFEVLADKLLEGPTPETVVLQIAGQDNVGAKRPYVAAANMSIADGDYDVNMKLVLSPLTLKEGRSSAVTLSLPNGIMAGYVIPVNISWGLSSKAKYGTDVTSVTFNNTTSVTPSFQRTGSATVKKTVTVTTAMNALLDNILENDETVWLVYKPTGFTTDSVALIIQDSTGLIPGNKDMKVELLTPSLTEGNSSNIQISFVNPAITAEEPISIALTRDPASMAAGTDFSFTTLTLPALTQSTTVNNGLTATTDGILEADETFSVIPTSSSIPGLNIPVFGGTILDATGANPSNKLITITASASTMNEGGTGYGFTYSLPAGITTEVPIVITPSLLAGSTASNGDFTLDSTTLTLDNLHNHSAYTGVTIVDDNVTEGDETLILGGTAASVIPGIQVNPGPTVIIKDKVVATTLLITTDRTEIVEGGAGASVTITLSNGAITSVPVNITISRGLSSGATTGYAGLPQTLSLVGNSLTFPAITALADDILGDNQTLVVYIDAAGYPKDSITLQIKDATDPSKGKITFTPQPTSQGTHVLEGNTYTIRAAFPAGVQPSQPVQLTVSASPLSTAGTTDYTGLPVNLTIDPFVGYKDFTIVASADNIIESAELLRIVGNVTNVAGITTDSLDVTIDDATSLDPAKSRIKVTIDSTAIHKGSFSKVTIGYEGAGVTSLKDLQIGFTPDPSSTADITNYSGIPTVVTIPKDSNFVTFYLLIPDNFKIEGTTILQFMASVTGYTMGPIAPINIIDKPGASIKVYKLADAGEPSTNGSFVIKLPLVQSTNVTVTLNVSYPATNIQPVPATVVIPAGTDSIIVPVLIKDDNIVQGNQPLQITLNKATTQTGIQQLVNATPAVLAVLDDESQDTGAKALARQILVERIADATQPSIEGAFRVRFTDTTLTATRDVSVNYKIAGTAVPGTDYVGLSGNVVIPTGSFSALVKVVPSGIMSAGANETVQLQMTAASSNIIGVIWGLSPVPQATVTIYNNNVDTPAINIFAETSIITEGDEIPFVIRATKPAKKDMPITVVVKNDVYRTISLSGGVVKGDTIIVTMAPGQTEKTIKVKINDNDINDDDGFILVSAKPYVPSTNPVYTLGLASEIRNTVSDNDSLRISFAESRYVAKVDFDTVDQPLPFKLTLNRTSSRIVTVYYEFYTPAAGELPAGTQPAEGGKDYNNTVVPLLILPNTRQSEIMVLVNGVERNKMFGMRLLRATVASNQHTPSVDSIVAAGGILEICMDCDADGDGVPDYVERFITDGRWKDNNNGDLRIHPAMSPNNDGLGNDALYIENIDRYPDNDITIFNRWGGTVFTTKGYNNLSNNFKGIGNAGSAKGQTVLDGSYFYIIHYTDGNGQKKRYIGYLVIKR